MKKPNLVLLLPFLLFGVGVFLYVQTQNEAYVRFARAEEQWRQGNHREALQLYNEVYREYPKSRYTDNALWEMGTIHYVNFYDVNRAVFYFQTLIAEYPESPLVKECQLQLAEIHDVELRDTSQAIVYWNQALSSDPSVRFQNRVLFKTANAYFKINQFQEALRRFSQLVGNGQDDHLAEQAQIRVGTIQQIRKEYPSSVKSLLKVLSTTQCSDCRIEAQLGLVESYEFMHELDKAIETAQAIRHDDYPAAMKQDLVKRLNEKRKYYGLKTWDGR